MSVGSQIDLSVCELSLLSIQAKDSDQLLKDLESIAPGLCQFPEVLRKNFVTATALPRQTTEQLQTAGIPELAAISIAAYHENHAGVSRHPTVQRIGLCDQTPDLSGGHNSEVTILSLDTVLFAIRDKHMKERQSSYISN